MAIQITNHNSPYETHNVYDVFFFDDVIRTTVTTDSVCVTRWISDVLHIHNPHYHIAGLDLEWRTTFGRVPQNPAATVQICVGRRCLIYHIIHSEGEIPHSLVDFLSDGPFTFAGVRVEADLEKLQNDYGIGYGARTLELGLLAAQVYNRSELRYIGLKNLATLVLGRDIEKPKRVSVSNWDNRWLTDEQVQYACVDAYVSSEIGRILTYDG